MRILETKARKMLQEIKEICNLVYHDSVCKSCPFGLGGGDRCFFDFDQKDQGKRKPSPMDWETDLEWSKGSNKEQKE